MRRADSRIRFRKPLAALVALGLLCASCGRALPTAPVSEAAPKHRSLAGTTRTNEDPDVVVAMLPPGLTGETLGQEFGATLLAGSTSLCARLAPGGGETCDGLVERLALDGRVITAERDAIIETAESRQESYASDDGNGSPQAWLEQPAAASIGLGDAHRVSNGRGVVVAVLDTGVDPMHPALRGHLTPGADFVDGDSSPVDATDGIDNDGDGRVDEAYGHGTHVAGLVALTAPDARIMPIRVLDADGRGGIAGVASGIQFALAHGARVLSISLGMLRNSDAIQNMLDDAEANGVVVVCSAGNWGAENPREFPAASSHAAAIGASDAAARPATFSSFGDHLVLCAPGVGVRSAYPGGGWRLWSGTSMSTPFVSGTAALLLAIHPQWNRDQVFARLQSTARPLVAVPTPQVGKLGDGMLDAGAALLVDFHPEPPPGESGDEATPKLARR